MIVWATLNYIVLVAFAVLRARWTEISSKSDSIRKNILEIVRDVDLKTQDGLDLLDNALLNAQEEIFRRQEFVRMLHEYGIYSMQKGITNYLQNEAQLSA